MAVVPWSEDVVVVHLADDPQCSDDLESLEEHLRAQPSSVVIDFSALKFINSSNIGRLLRVRRMLGERGRTLVLCGLSTAVWGTFLVSGVDQLFTCADDIPTALATVQLS